MKNGNYNKKKRLNSTFSNNIKIPKKNESPKHSLFKVLPLWYSNITELTEENEPQGTTLINQRPPCIGEEDGKINQMDSIKE